MQGKQLVVYGGEYQPEADENQDGNASGGEDQDSVACNEMYRLEPDMKLWVTVPITGTAGQ